jgi:NAD(P)-dependent dehydrogenase (short-subunit alcohol dehydrogenase family)
MEKGFVFSGRCAVITGAGSGIGRAIAHSCADEGMNLVVADIDDAGVAAVAREVQDRGAKAIPVTVDVANAASVDSLADRAYEEFGEVAILCNNAGVPGLGKKILDITRDDWNRVLSVNLYGVIHGIQAFLPRMVAQGTRCHIVNTGSMASLRPASAAYTTSKYGVLAISETTARDLAGTLVGVSVICPGPTDTNIHRASAHLSPEVERQQKAKRDALPEGQIVDSSVVGQAVIDAVRDNRLYNIIHPQLRDFVAERFTRILDAFDEAAERESLNARRRA